MAGIVNLDVKDYKQQYGNTAHVLVDVREVEEYQGGHLPGALNLPLSTFQETYEQIPTDKTVVLVCKTGGRSLMAAEFLHSKGKYGELVNLDGGTEGWVKAGNPVE